MPALRCARGSSEPDPPRHHAGDAKRCPLRISSQSVRGISRSLLATGFAFLSLLPVAAQENSSPSEPPVFAQFATQPEGLIHLDVAVTDPARGIVVGLGASDFTLLDNGQPRKILTFRSSTGSTDPNARLNEIVFVIDQVNLPPPQVALVRSGVAQFLRQNNGRLPVPVSIYWFRRTGLYAAAAAPSTNGNQLADAVAHNRVLRRLGGKEAQPQLLNIPPDIAGLGRRLGNLWDEALQSVYTIALERRGVPGRKALLWFGPGWPVDAGHFQQNRDAFDSLVELSTRIRQARLVLCQVPVPVMTGVGNAAESVQPFDDQDDVAGVRSLQDLGKDPRFINAHFALPVLAIQSGGLIADQEVEKAIESCIRASSFFYTLSFDPPKTSTPDEYHALSVKVRGSTARTSTGYYDQPVFYDQPRVPTERLTVHELEQTLDGAAPQSDAELADQLTGMELTERLSSSDLARLLHPLGKKSKDALTALADESAFLELPTADILAEPPLDAATQQQVLSLTRTYLQSVLPKLPDFYATRTTVEYQQPAPKEDDTWNTALPDQSLRAAVTVKATLRYRGGHEEQDVKKQKGSHSARQRSLNLVGVFGPLLDVAFSDATSPPGRLTWARWESGPAGKVAVFHYEVPAPNSIFSVGNCCLKGHRPFLATPPGRGEITIDPQTGAILRFTMESEPGWILEPNLHPVQPVLKTRTMVEYGPVEIGGKTYICPLRSILIMRTRPVRQIYFWDEPFEIYSSYETMLDDFSYTDYHKFGSESRILPGFEPVPNPPPPGR